MSVRLTLAAQFALAALACPMQATAGDAPASPQPEWTGTPPAREWTLQVEPKIWFPALRGEVTPKGGSTFEAKEVDLDEVHAAPAGEVTLRGGRWAFTLNGFAINFDGSKRASTAIDGGSFDVGAGDRIKFDVSFSAFKLTGGYSFDPLVRDDDAGVAVWFDAYAGVQVYHLDLDLGPEAGGGLSESKTWAEPLVGIGLNIDLPHGFEVAVTIDAGATLGGGTGFAWDISPRFRWFVMENRNVAVEIGFRHVFADLVEGSGDDDFEWNMAAAGLFGSVVIRF